jgi:hypothetical protein
VQPVRRRDHHRAAFQTISGARWRPEFDRKGARKRNPRCENGHTLQANSDVTYPNSDPLVNVDAVLIRPHGVHLSK